MCAFNQPFPAVHSLFCIAHVVSLLPYRGLDIYVYIYVYKCTLTHIRHRRQERKLPKVCVCIYTPLTSLIRALRIYIYIRIYVYIHIHTYILIRAIRVSGIISGKLCTAIYSSMCVCVCIHVFVCVCVCVCVCIYTYVYIYIHTYMYMYIYIYICMCIYIYIYIYIYIALHSLFLCRDTSLPVAVRCSVLQCVAVCCSVFPAASSWVGPTTHIRTLNMCWSVLRFALCVAVCCSVFSDPPS